MGNIGAIRVIKIGKCLRQMSNYDIQEVNYHSWLLIATKDKKGDVLKQRKYSLKFQFKVY